MSLYSHAMQKLNAQKLVEFGMERMNDLLEENRVLREEIKVSREAAEITARLATRQFEETEEILNHFQIANARRKAVLDSATQVAIIATDEDGVIAVFNTGAENLLGYRAGEVVGRETPLLFHKGAEIHAWSQRLSTDSGRNVVGLDVFFEMARQGRCDEREWTFIRKEGTCFPVSMSINAVRDPDGRAKGFLCIAHDITKEKVSKKALQDSEKKYWLLMSNLPNVVFKGYADGAIDFFDDKVEALTGYTRQQFLDRDVKWNDIVLPEDMRYAADIFKKALRGNKSYIREYRMRAKNGDIIWIQEGGQIICDEDGRIDHVTGAFLDVTERKQAEKALHESEQKYRSLFDSGPNPIFVLDADDLTVLDANPSAEKTYGYTKREILGKCFPDLGTFDPGDRSMFQLTNGECKIGIVENQKVRQYRKGRKPFFINYRTCPTRYRDRDAIILAVTDITEMMEKDAQLIQASKMSTLGEMSAGIAHELNQPLNAIKLGNEYIKTMAEKGQDVPREDLLSVVSEVTNQVQRASQIINRLRDFGRKTDFDKETVDVNRPVRNVLGMIGQQLKLDDIRLKLSLDDSLPPIQAHNNRLEQVIFNLISNARDAILQKRENTGEPRSHSISVRSWMADDRVVFSISDTGTGIPRDARDRVFEPFFTTKEVGRGMGLGLSIIYGIVRDYNGVIDVDSEIGRGTTFTVSFPAKPVCAA